MHFSGICFLPLSDFSLFSKVQTFHASTTSSVWDPLTNCLPLPNAIFLQYHLYSPLLHRSLNTFPGLIFFKVGVTSWLYTGLYMYACFPSSWVFFPPSTEPQFTWQLIDMMHDDIFILFTNVKEIKQNPKGSEQTSSVKELVDTWGLFFCLYTYSTICYIFCL